MTISEHVSTLLGLPVQIFKPQDTIKPNHACKIRVSWDDDDEDNIHKHIDALLNDPSIASLTALIIGAWEPEVFDEAPDELSQKLIDNKSKLSNLRALFYGDITYEECEMSWLLQRDQSDVLHALPNLDEAYFRGGQGLRFSNLSHQNVKKFVVQTGGMSSELLKDIINADLPSIEHLELWLGTDDYGWDGDVSLLKPIFDGSLFPNLQYLGLKNSIESDAIAELICGSPILDRIAVLDLSMGTISDSGAQALINCPQIKNLQSLHLDHHYMSDATIGELMKLGINVTSTERCDDDEYDGEVYRYVEVGE